MPPYLRKIAWRLSASRPGPWLKHPLSHPIRTSMALMVVRTGFAKTTLIMWQHIPADWKRVATICRLFDYFRSHRRLRMSAMGPHLALQEGAAMKCCGRPDAVCCCPCRATHYMMCLVVGEACERKRSLSHLCKLMLAGASRSRLTGPCRLNDITPIQGLGVPLHAVAAGHERQPAPGSASQAPTEINVFAQRFANLPPW